jgi:hypothetical protein
MLYNPWTLLSLYSARSHLKRPSFNVGDHFEVFSYLLHRTTIVCFLFPILWHFEISIN